MHALTMTFHITFPLQVFSCSKVQEHLEECVPAAVGGAAPRSWEVHLVRQLLEYPQHKELWCQTVKHQLLGLLQSVF